VTVRWKSLSVAASGFPANVLTRTLLLSTGCTVAVAGVAEDGVAV
jgi:hypothetical protein